MNQQDSSASFDPSSFKILCVDDEPNILSALRRMLMLQGFQVTTAGSGEEALKLMGQERFDVLISDMQMPVISGTQLLAQARQHHPRAMRLLLTGAADVASAIAAINEGEIYRYMTKPWNDDEFVATVRSALEFGRLTQQRDELLDLTKAQNQSLQEMVATLEERVLARTEDLTASNSKLRAAYVACIKSFAGLLELRRPDLLVHSRRVAYLSRRIAQQMGLSEEQSQEVFIAGLLHDIGKIGLRDRVLNSKFIELPRGDVEDYRTHGLMGQASLASLEDMGEVGRIVRSHHEYFNGSGFPDGLAGDDIPVGARIVALVEAFEEQQSGDYAQSASSPQDAARTVLSNRGKLFCPTVCDHFARVWNAPPVRGE